MSKNRYKAVKNVNFGPKLNSPIASELQGVLGLSFDIQGITCSCRIHKRPFALVDHVINFWENTKTVHF